MKKPLALGLHILVHLVPAFYLYWLYKAAVSGALGGEPVESIIHFLGLGSLRLLLLTLAVSPCAKLFNWGRLNKLRRPLGLWCFTWACLHFAAWLWLDLALDWSLIGKELIKRTYIVVGFFCWLVLLALAVSSLPFLLKKMGSKWKRLHAWIYPVAILACVHFWWSLKSGWIEPAIYLVLFCSLLVLRKKKLLLWLPLSKKSKTRV